MGAVGPADRLLHSAPTRTARFRTSWQHEITAQQAFALDSGQQYPVWVAYQGDSPVEYPSEEDPQEPAPFSLTDVDRMLAAVIR